MHIIIVREFLVLGELLLARLTVSPSSCAADVLVSLFKSITCGIWWFDISFFVVLLFREPFCASIQIVWRPAHRQRQMLRVRVRVHGSSFEIVIY